MAQRSFRTVASPTHAGRWHRHSRPLKLLQIHFLVTCLLMCHCKPLPPSCWINRLDRRQPLFHLWITLSGPLAWLDYLHHSRARILHNGALETTFASLILSLASQPAGSDSCTCHVSSSPLTSLVLSPFSRRPFISRGPDCWWFIKLSVRVTTCSRMVLSHTSFRRLRDSNRTCKT